jgi:hypothetical protein
VTQPNRILCATNGLINDFSGSEDETSGAKAQWLRVLGGTPEQAAEKLFSTGFPDLSG